jgi:hypothetical protein
MKELFQILILMCIVAVVTSCASTKKYRCKGLSAHPNYKKSWTKN